MEKYQKPSYNATLREVRREEDQKIVGDRLSEKWGKVEITELRFLAADRQK
jgi:hypothetical protein